MTGKTYINQEIITALSKRGHDFVTCEYYDKTKDTVDTLYVETEFGAIIRIAISEVPKT